MTSSTYRFHFSPYFTIFVAVVITAMCLLGNWQFNRAEEKRVLLAHREAESALRPIEIENVEQIETALFRSLKLVGHYEKNYFLLENQMRNGVVGYEVIQPFAIHLHKRILINRGWLPADINLSVLPRVDTPQGEVALFGRLNHLPQVGFKLGYQDSGNWPKVVQYLDDEMLAKLLGPDVYPYVIQLSSDQSFGFERTWPGVAIHPEKHTAYALQWYGMAIALFVVYLFFSFKKIVGV